MKVAAIRLWQVPPTSHTAYDMVGRKACDTVETVFVAVRTGAAMTGSRDLRPTPQALPACVRSVAPALQELAARIVDADPLGPEALIARDRYLPRHVHAKSPGMSSASLALPPDDPELTQRAIEHAAAAVSGHAPTHG